MKTNDQEFTKMLSGFQTLMKGLVLKDKKTMMKIMQLENDQVALMEKQLELEAAIRGKKVPKRGLGLWNRLLLRLGTPRYSKQEMKGVQATEVLMDSFEDKKHE